MIQHANTSGIQAVAYVSSLDAHALYLSGLVETNTFGALGCDKHWQSVHDSTCWLHVS